MYTVLTDYKSSGKATWHAKKQAHRSGAGSLSPANLLTVSPSPDPFSSKHNKLFISLQAVIFFLPFPSASSLHDDKIYSHKQTLFFYGLWSFSVLPVGCFLERFGLLRLMSGCHLYFLTCWKVFQQFPWTKADDVESKLRVKLQCFMSKEYFIVTLSWEYANET